MADDCDAYIRLLPRPLPPRDDDSRAEIRTAPSALVVSRSCDVDSRMRRGVCGENASKVRYACMALRLLRSMPPLVEKESDTRKNNRKYSNPRKNGQKINKKALVGRRFSYLAPPLRSVELPDAPGLAAEGAPLDISMTAIARVSELSVYAELYRMWYASHNTMRRTSTEG